jgi:hypothetical protein
MNRIKVGPPVVTIHQGSTFMITTASSEISPDAELGLFAEDTRLISGYRLLVDRQPWTVATSAAVSYFGARYVFLSPKILASDGSVEPGKIELMLERTVENGFHEDFDITNYFTSELSLHLEIAIESDFADIFEVKRHQIKPRQIDTDWNSGKGELTSIYRRCDFERGVTYRVKRSDTPPHFANGAIHFGITLPPRGTWHACCEIIPINRRTRTTAAQRMLSGCVRR